LVRLVLKLLKIQKQELKQVKILLLELLKEELKMLKKIKI